MNYLKFRRQFILSNKELSTFPNWKHIKLTKNISEFTLYFHTDLSFEHVINDKFELILLGYIIDPFRGELSSLEVLRQLSKNVDFTGVVISANSLSGRFVIVYNDGESIKVLNDATGLREVYYFNNRNVIACGSSSNILADSFQIPLDSEKEINRFFSSPELNDNERRWIGIRTIFKDVYHLLPNHYLALKEGKAIRFWPTEPLKMIGLKEAASIISEILVGTYEAACQRYTLYQGLTGGWDTRVLLAAAKVHLKNIRFYFIRGFKSDNGFPNSGDYAITKEIAQVFNIPVDFIVLNNNQIDPEFEKEYYQNNVLARPKLLKVYYDIYNEKLDNTVTVAGTGGNEILRLLSNLNRNVTSAKKMAGFLGYEKYPYVIESIDEWINETVALKNNNYKLIDLYNWEQFFGNWGPLSVSEQDIVREELRPFNNRLLISTYLSLKDNYRYKDYPHGHVQVIKQLWPELLNYPFDMKYGNTKRILRSLGLEIFADKVFQRLKTL